MSIDHAVSSDPCEPCASATTAGGWGEATITTLNPHQAVQYARLLIKASDIAVGDRNAWKT